MAAEWDDGQPSTPQARRSREVGRAHWGPRCQILWRSTRSESRRRGAGKCPHHPHVKFPAAREAVLAREISCRSISRSRRPHTGCQWLGRASRRLEREKAPGGSREPRDGEATSNSRSSPSQRRGPNSRSSSPGSHSLKTHSSLEFQGLSLHRRALTVTSSWCLAPSQELLLSRLSAAWRQPRRMGTDATVPKKV